MAYDCNYPVAPPVVLQGGNLTTVPIFITGTDPAVGVIDGSNLSTDYTPDIVGPDGTFVIFIELAGIINVQLADGNDYQITAVQATAHLGKMFPAKIKKIYESGTVGDFSVAY